MAEFDLEKDSPLQSGHSPTIVRVTALDELSFPTTDLSFPILHSDRGRPE